MANKDMKDIEDSKDTKENENIEDSEEDKDDESSEDMEDGEESWEHQFSGGPHLIWIRLEVSMLEAGQRWSFAIGIIIHT